MSRPAKDVDTSIRGRSKAKLAESLKELGEVGDFFTQHSMLLLSKLGSARALKEAGVVDVQETCTLGSGCHDLLHVLLEEQVGFAIKRDLSPADYESLALRERNRFALVAANLFKAGEISHVPYCLRKLKTKGAGFEAIPEAFGDFCCESRKLLLQLLGLKALSKHYRSIIEVEQSNGKSGGCSGFGKQCRSNLVCIRHGFFVQARWHNLRV